MASAPVLTTARLRLRPWRDADLPKFAVINADPVAMEFFASIRTRAESDEMVTRIIGHFERHGFGLWAVEVVGVADFVGFVGLNVPDFQTRFTPCVEIGWRLAPEHWGQGYATEAAKEAIRFGFQMVRLDSIVSFTVPANVRSRAVMERLGMTRSEAEDFDHPLLEEGHRLRRHVLYRMTRADWERLNC